MNNGDREILRLLASRWMEIANLPVMAGRKRQWTALKDLRAERPMVLFETWTLENYVADDEIAHPKIIQDTFFFVKYPFSGKIDRLFIFYG